MLYPICSAVSSLFLVCVMPKCSVMCSAVLCQSASLFVSFHAHKYSYFHFALEEKNEWEKLSLSVCSNFQSPKAFYWLGRWQFDPSGHEGGTKHQQSFQFGSEEQTAWVSLTNQCWSKLDDVTTFTTELLNVNPLHVTFLKHTDWISGSKVSKQLRTIVIFSHRWLSLRV